MFKKTKKAANQPVNTGTFTLQTEIAKNSPLTAAPADPYSFELADAFGNLGDEQWYVKRLDELGSILDETAGNYVDREIVRAMEVALKALDAQRGAHVSVISDAEQVEEAEADGLSDSIEDLLIKLTAAKRRYAHIVKKGA